MNEAIATLIRDARTALGWTQDDLARAVGVKAQGVSKWERAISAPQRETAERVDDVLGLDGELLDALGYRAERVDLVRAELSQLAAEVRALRRAVRELQEHASWDVENELDATRAEGVPRPGEPSAG